MPKKQKRVKKNSLPDGELDMAISKSLRIKKDSHKYFNELRQCVDATNTLEDILIYEKACVIFGQEEGGGGVFISNTGDILTCAHCLEDDVRIGQLRTVVDSSGVIYLTESVKINEVSDLALFCCLGYYDVDKSTTTKPVWVQLLDGSVNFIEIMNKENTDTTDLSSLCTESKLTRRSRRGSSGPSMVCIGQNLIPRHPLFMGSSGNFLGIDSMDNINDNFDLGQLRHSCNTGYGTSGAPLIFKSKLVGIHNSWNADAHSRHGIHFQCILNFLHV